MPLTFVVEPDGVVGVSLYVVGEVLLDLLRGEGQVGHPGQQQVVGIRGRVLGGSDVRR